MRPFPALFDVGPTELLVILAVFVLLFGATKIPAVAKALGRAKGDFERGKREAERELDAGESEVLAEARRLGVPTDGRALDEIRRDVEARKAKSA